MAHDCRVCAVQGGSNSAEKPVSGMSTAEKRAVAAYLKGLSGMVLQAGNDLVAEYLYRGRMRLITEAAAEEREALGMNRDYAAERAAFHRR